ncbi:MULTISPECIES: nickel-dependent lactate racemase [Butyrivibrio]|jgi:nickel-dependent lactate racemase|uniref:Nickel-dependent lactate racemase n=1 Tax=Butyrivibrio proteoclasticus TaxID=43305 RepID=A0A1I5SWI2_9FIRM|nr:MULTISPECIES: nickel-dependent lactate racemase [Butyrivibrio]MBE5839484.1 nickel-dependent lactate racemase [Butyrivibrio sp.]SFP75144.1 Nickel-dependent lactate racemase [Butyrivibrio proteoclasticus]
MKKTISIPYYTSTMDIHVEEENLKAVITAKMHEFKTEKTEVELVKEALEHPIGVAPLCELAKGKKKVVLVTSDHTRAVPSKITLPLELAEIRKGSPDADITILIATGLHRATTEEEQRRMFGDEIVDNEKIAINNAFEPADFADMGTLPSGAEFHVNKLATECDLLICEGFIEPHFFAGFSGGRKSILPGICSQETVNMNHSYQAIASKYAKTGVLEHNPIHEDMLCAARRVNVQFILNVALNAEKKVIAAWAGDLEAAHAQGVKFIREWSQCPSITGDIVVTSNGGYPLDQNLYQSPKAVATAEACAGEDGVIIMCCSCADGMGGTHFEKLIQMGTPEEIDAYLSKIPAKDTIPEQWCPQIYARILHKHKMILVTTYLDPETVKKCNMIPAKTPDEALEIAYGIKGKDASVVVIPDGVSVLAVAPEN